MEITRLATECGSISGLISPADWPPSTIFAKRSCQPRTAYKSRIFIEFKQFAFFDYTGFRYVMIGPTFVVRDRKLREDVAPGQAIRAQ
jgi:hypothetical protein